MNYRLLSDVTSRESWETDSRKPLIINLKILIKRLVLALLMLRHFSGIEWTWSSFNFVSHRLVLIVYLLIYLITMWREARNERWEPRSCFNLPSRPNAVWGKAPVNTFLCLYVYKVYSYLVNLCFLEADGVFYQSRVQEVDSFMFIRLSWLQCSCCILDSCVHSRHFSRIWSLMFACPLISSNPCLHPVAPGFRFPLAELSLWLFLSVIQG